MSKSKSYVVICKHSHRVTITLPWALSLEAQEAVLDFLRKTYWQYLASYTWRDAMTLRLIAKSSAEAFMIVRQYAERFLRQLAQTT